MIVFDDGDGAMIWREEIERWPAQTAFDRGEWHVQRFEIGGNADLRFLAFGSRTTRSPAPVALCESVPEAHIVAALIEHGADLELGAPLEQLFDAGYVEDRRAPREVMLRLTRELARRPDAADPVVTDELLWMTRRNGAVTIAVDEAGSAPIISFYQDLHNEQITCGTVFYRRDGIKPSSQLGGCLRVLHERQGLNGTPIEPLQNDQHQELLARLTAGDCPVSQSPRV